MTERDQASPPPFATIPHLARPKVPALSTVVHVRADGTFHTAVPMRGSQGRYLGLYITGERHADPVNDGGSFPCSLIRCGVHG